MRPVMTTQASNLPVVLVSVLAIKTIQQLSTLAGLMVSGAVSVQSGPSLARQLQMKSKDTKVIKGLPVLEM